MFLFGLTFQHAALAAMLAPGPIAFQRNSRQSKGVPHCPECGGVTLYTYRTRHLWKCKACQHQFSVASGTIVASHSGELL